VPHNYRAAFGLILIFLSRSAAATNWTERQLPDPILRDAKCMVQEPSSWGSYIYDEPSKYDQVFWPYTASEGIWFCYKSGFAAFVHDFGGLTDAEQSNIAAYLKEHYPGFAGPLGARDQLRLLEDIYALRDKDSEFRNQLLRVLAVRYESLGDTEKATAYRRAALLGIRTALSGDLDTGTRLEYMYVAANYERLFGDRMQSDSDLAALASALDHVKDKTLKHYVGYLRALARETPRITPGGVLRPAAVGAHP
jgi:hypothetical protein